MSYPQLTIDLQKIKENTTAITNLASKQGIEVAGVIKGCDGLVLVAEAMVRGGCLEIASSRLWHLEQCRETGLNIPLLLVRLPMLNEIDRLIRIANTSLNSERHTLDAIEKACAQQDCSHQVILMYDVGDLREGILDLQELVELACYVEVKLEHVHLRGLGTNMTCYGSVRPTQTNTQALCNAVSAIEEVIGRQLEIVSAGASTSLPLLLTGEMPERVNHIRIGAAILTPNELYNFWNFRLPETHLNPFTLQAQVIEVNAKPTYPIGEIVADDFGYRNNYLDRGVRRRAILAVGNVDLGNCHKLIPKDSTIQVLGASSDHLLIDIEDYQGALEVGDIVEFGLLYVPLPFLSNNKSVHKLYLNDFSPPPESKE